MTPARQRALKERFRDLVETVGGVDAAAGFCRPGKTALAQHYSLSPADADRFPPADAVIALEAVAGDAMVTRYMAAEAGALLVPMIVNAMGAGDLLRLMASKSRASTDLTEHLLEAQADGDFDPVEARQALEKMDDLLRVAATMRAFFAQRAGEAQ